MNRNQPTNHKQPTYRPTDRLDRQTSEKLIFFSRFVYVYVIM